MSLFGDVDVQSAEDDPYFIPDSSYPAFLTDVKVGPTKNGDKTGMTITYKISEGDFEGREVTEWKYLPEQMETVEEKRAMSFLKSRLLDLGIPAERVNEVQADDLIGREVIIAIKNKNGYTNIRNVQLVD